MKLLFYKGRKAANPNSTLWDNLICWITASEYSHVEVAYFSYHIDHLCWSASTRDGGVRCKKIIVNPDHWTIIDVKTPQHPDWFNVYKGMPYDYIGLLCTLFNTHIFDSKSKWFCSELIAAYFKLDKPWTYTPEMLYKLFTK